MPVTRGRFVLVALLLTALTPGVCLPAAACARPPAAQTVVRRAVDSYRRLVDYQADLVLEVFLPGLEQRLEAKQWFKKPNLYRMEVVAPEDMRGQVTSFDGRTTWTYCPLTGEVVVFRGSPVELTDEQEGALVGSFVDALMRESEASLLGTAKLDGRDAYVLQIKARMAGETGTPEPAVQKLWIDRRMWLPTKMEVCDSRGRTRVSAALRALEVNTGLTDEFFRFRAPPGSRMIEGAVGTTTLTLDEAQAEVDFRLAMPEYLPPQFQLGLVGKVDEPGPVAVVLSFHDGERVVTLMERRVEEHVEGFPGARKVKVEGEDGELLASEGFCLLRWRRGDVGFTLMGSISAEEAMKIARSIK